MIKESLFLRLEPKVSLEILPGGELMIFSDGGVPL